MPELKQENDVESQTSPINGPDLKNPYPDIKKTKQSLENQTRIIPVRCLNDFQEKHPEIQEIKSDMTANYNGDDNHPTPNITTSQIEKNLWGMKLQMNCT